MNIFRYVAVVSLCVLAADATANSPLMPLKIGDAVLHVEVAADPQARQLGLMYRKSLPADQGMLFRFGQAGIQCLWMKNTFIPLTAAFLDEEGAVVDLIDLEPESLETRCTKAPALYAIEANQGWFDKHEIRPGAVVEGIEDHMAK
ncbi:DUF192 domain-containing protein [Pseudomonas sp. Marseille-QA0892]